MYVVKLDGNLLYNSLSPLYDLESPILLQRANSVGKFEFCINDEHPLYNSINMVASEIKIYKDGTLKWLGIPKRQLSVDERSKTIVCDCCLSFLKDSFIAPYDFSGTVSDFFEYIVGCHNDSVSERQRFVIGTCNVGGESDTIIRSSVNYDNAFSVIKEKLLDYFGGYLYVTFDENEHAVLSYYADVPYTTTQSIEVGKNLVEYEHELFYDEFYTACVPLGYKAEESGKRLTIESVNDGIPYLYDSELVAQYGFRFAPTKLTTWDNVTLPANLKTKGQDWLDNEGIVYKDSVTLDAVDISRIQQGIQSFEFLWKAGFKLRSGQVVYYVISSLETNLATSANVSITLGDVKKMYTSLVSGNVSNVESIVNEIYSDYTTSHQSQQIAETVLETTTQIQIQATAIVQSVLETFYTVIKDEIDEDIVEKTKELYSQVEQLADSITASFSYYEVLNGVVTDIQSWVKIIPETSIQSGGIIIGNSLSEIKLKLENDILYFYKGSDTNPVVLMYVDSTTVHVNRVEIQHLSIGSTGKMLDFRILGTGVNTCVMFSGRLVLS